MKYNIQFFFRKYVGKKQISLKPNKNKGYFTWRRFYIYDNISLHSSHNEKRLNKNCVENQNTHFTINNFFSKIMPFVT